jgi:hypothetical protein
MELLDLPDFMVSWKLKRRGEVCPLLEAPSSQGLASEIGENEGGLMDLLAVVLAQLLLLFLRPRASVLAANHEADLAGWVGRDGGVGIFDNGEDFFALLLQVGNERHVKPLVFSFIKEVEDVSSSELVRGWH